MRVRIAQATSTNSSLSSPERGYDSSFLDTTHEDMRSSSETLVSSDESEGLDPAERRTLDKVGEALARLGRSKRVGLGVKEKREFVKVWGKSHKTI